MLDPRISYDGLEADIEDTNTDAKAELELSKEKLRMYYQTHYTKDLTAVVAPAPAATPASIRSPQKVDFTSRYKKKQKTHADEFDTYFRQDQENFNTCDPIQWWFARRAQFPTLSQLALDILTIPGMFYAAFSLWDAKQSVRLCRCRRAYLLRWKRYYFSVSGQPEGGHDPDPHACQTEATPRAQCDPRTRTYHLA